MTNINNIDIGNKNLQAVMFEGATTKTELAPIQYYKYANDAGGYYVKGIWIAPLINGISSYRWPWDLGVTGGALKDTDDGWSHWGYVQDGYNKNLTSGLSNFPTNGYTIRGIGISIYYNESNYTDSNGKACLDFGDNPVVITFKDGRFDDVTWSDDGNGSVYEWSEDKRTITIYRVGSGKQVCRFNWTDDTSINKCITLLKDIYADVLGLEQYTTDKTYVDLQSQECWDAYQGNTLVYHKDKTVENCLAKYYGTTDENGVITINSYTDSTTTVPVLPQLSGITDLNNYDTTKLKISSKGSDNDNATVEWLNSNYEKLMENSTDLIVHLIANGNYGCIKVNNTEDNPVIIYCPLGMEEDPNSESNYEVLDNILYDSNLGGSNINYLKIIFKDKGISFKNTISVAKNSFRSLKVKNLEIEHQEADGTVVTPYNLDWGFKPMQLQATFTFSNIKVLKREWMSWERVTTIPYVFDYATSLTEIQSNGETCIFYPHNIDYPTGKGAENVKWPYFIGASDDVECWEATQAFNGCNSLKRIEPIFNVYYWDNPDKYYKMFAYAQNIEYVKIKGLNNMDYDFTSAGYLYLPKLNTECIQYLFDNLTDQVTVAYNEANVDTTNVSSEYPDVYFDHINVRSSRSVDGLNLYCPPEWGGFGFSTYQGMTVYSANGGTKVDHNNMTISTRYTSTGSTLMAAICTQSVTNFKFKVEGLIEGDTLAVGQTGKLSLQTNTYIEDGEYTIESLDSYWGFSLFNDVPYGDAIETTTTEGKSINSSGTEIDAEGYEVTDYIAVDNCKTIMWYNGEANGSCKIVEYDESKAVLDYWNPNSTTRNITLAGGTNTKYIRIGIKSSVKSTTYVTDETNLKYLFKGEDVVTKTYASTDTTPVQITIISCDEYLNKITTDMIAAANAKGWSVYINNVLQEI